MLFFVNSFRKEHKVEEVPLQLESSPLPLDVLRMFPTVGTVLRVYIDSGSEKLGLHILKTGRWVKIMKMKCEIREGMWYGVLMPSTKLRYLGDDNKHVFMCQRSLLSSLLHNCCVLNVPCGRNCCPPTFF